MKVFIVALLLLMPAARGDAAQQLSASEMSADDTRLQQRAVEARSAAEHADVARMFRERAEALTIEAERLEASFRRTRGVTSPMASKWPALDPGASTNRADRRRALQLREAAAQAARTATRHHALAIERGFGAVATD